MAGSAYTGRQPYYDYIDMICIHSYDIKTGMDILIGSSFAFSIEYSGSMMPVLAVF
jgi:hypothetical protein